MKKRQPTTQIKSLNHLLTVAEILKYDAEGGPNLTRQLNARAMEISKKHVVRWTPALKAFVCKKCGGSISPFSKSCNIKTDLVKVVVQCGMCGKIRTFPYNKWIERISKTDSVEP